eukprot:CAMPEP_0206364740 /NCGR_PEP_ID=MMETSP0294-20121207/2407_1 /ASSEMBLY_ACC=CAM_ASM_000327 /TAXON_ID=39354 /ORGANISM="Heterosigma akashiwo, Strain CCMP2393" /LENGTH=131 /DNA_ID=CAMNT_0053810413 /DNA_START=1458 /DNA_END=1853 /DNA_ORIENTATION=+
MMGPTTPCTPAGPPWAHGPALPAHSLPSSPPAAWPCLCRLQLDRASFLSKIAPRSPQEASARPPLGWGARATPACPVSQAKWPGRHPLWPPLQVVKAIVFSLSVKTMAFIFSFDRFKLARKGRVLRTASTL